MKPELRIVKVDRSPGDKVRDRLTGIEWTKGRPVPQGVVVARSIVIGVVVAWGTVAFVLLALVAWQLATG